MKSLLDKDTREELISRIERVKEETQPEWGEMSAYQMLKHCRLAEELYLAKFEMEQIPLGKEIGQSVLKDMLKDEAPMMKNAKTHKAFIVSDEGDMETEKANWISLIREYEHYSNPFITHWFFGKMDLDEIGRFSYKHADHHLRQFHC